MPTMPWFNRTPFWYEGIELWSSVSRAWNVRSRLLAAAALLLVLGLFSRTAHAFGNLILNRQSAC